MADERIPCPACGGLLLQQNAHACPYCGHALNGSGAEPGPNAGRLGKMNEHEAYEALMAWSPRGDDHEQATRRVRLGVALAVVGGLLVASTIGAWSWGRFVPGAAVLAAGLVSLARGLKGRTAISRRELRRRPAIVTDRRSETAFNGWSGRVTYYFTLEFEDGVQGEFRFPGRGWPHEPLARGATGIAYTRGNDLLEFQSIKV